MLALRNMPLVVDLNDLGEATSQVRSYESVSHLLVLTMAFPRHTQMTDHAQAVRSGQYLHFLTTDNIIHLFYGRKITCSTEKPSPLREFFLPVYKTFAIYRHFVHASVALCNRLSVA